MKLKHLLLGIEIASVCVAVVFGILWLKNPTGSYEPIVALSGTIGVGIELLRRFFRHDEVNENENPDDLSSQYSWLRKNVYDLELSRLLQVVIRLAQKSNNKNLEKWARLELNGYYGENGMSESDIVPIYRSVGGQHMDEYGRPLIVTEPELSFINEIRLRHGIKELEELTKESKSVFVRDIATSHILKENLGVEVTRFVFNSSAVKGVIEKIRTNLIDRLPEIKI